MVHYRTLLLMIVAPFLVGSVSAQAAESFRPIAEVRTLALYQDRLTQGDQASIRLQQEMIGRIAREFRVAPLKTWSVWRNSVAAVKYLISGGDPTFAERDEFVGVVPEGLRSLLIASRAYAQGDASTAKKLFAKIDQREIDASLGGHVALIKSLLAFPENPKASMELLDDARLLGAGTLVEEAAIRRQIGLVVRRQNHKRFQKLSMRYVRKFQRSLFASAFREHLADGLTSKSFKLDQQRTAWLIALFDRLDAQVRPEYCMLIAERGLVRGRPDLVKIATTRLQQDVDRGSGLGQRAKLFNAAMAVVDDDAKAVTKLEKLKDFQPGSFESHLRDAAIAMAKGIAMPVGDEEAEEPLADQRAGKTGAEPDRDFAETRRAALSAIKDARTLLAQQ